MILPLISIGFLELSIIDILDILMVAFIIFVLFKWIKGSSAMNIFIAIIIILLLRVLVDILNMKMMSVLMGAFIDIGAIAIVVIFQPEIRNFLYNLGKKTVSGKSRAFFDKIFRREDTAMAADSTTEIALACSQMSETKTGALIVIHKQDTLRDIVSTGDVVDAKISSRLIQNIFFKNSPLHDGAMVISADRIEAARCTLPITSRTDIPPRLGMRHKAAIGISEKCDAAVIVVSEETGRISYVQYGHLTEIDNINQLKLLLSNDRQKTGSKAGV